MESQTPDQLESTRRNVCQKDLWIRTTLLTFVGLLNIVLHMVKTITKVGNSQGLIFDATLLEMAHLRIGDEVNVEVHEGGTITVTPIRTKPSRDEVTRVVKKTMKDYARTMKRLA